MPSPAAALRWAAAVWFGCVYALRLLGLVIHVLRVRVCSNGRAAPPLEPGSDHSSEGVTILRPLKGVDDARLYECLRSTFVQTYSPVEILMCVSDPADPAVAVAHRLLAEFPAANARILVGPDPRYGLNPKVNNLVKGYKAAAHDIIWCLDSNVLMHPRALERAVPRLRGSVQLVHHLPLALADSTQPAEPGSLLRAPDGWGGRLDEAYMLTAHSTFYTGINAVGIAPCVTGKSNMYRRSRLDAAVGAPAGAGLEAFAKYMAEDQMISEALWAAGGRTAIAADAAVQPVGRHIMLRDYWNRRARWIRLRKYMVTSATLVEPFTDTLFNVAFIVAVWGWSMPVFAALVLVSFAVDLVNYRVLLGYTAQPAMPWFEWVLAWSVRELLAFPLWLWAMSGRRIWWRDHYYKIRHDLAAEEAD